MMRVILEKVTVRVGVRRLFVAVAMMVAVFGLITVGPAWAVHLPAKAKSIKGDFVTGYTPWDIGAMNALFAKG